MCECDWLCKETTRSLRNDPIAFPFHGKKFQDVSTFEIISAYTYAFSKFPFCSSFKTWQSSLIALHKLTTIFFFFGIYYLLMLEKLES